MVDRILEDYKLLDLLEEDNAGEGVLGNLLLYHNITTYMFYRQSVCLQVGEWEQGTINYERISRSTLAI